MMETERSRVDTTAFRWHLPADQSLGVDTTSGNRPEGSECDSVVVFACFLGRDFFQVGGVSGSACRQSQVPQSISQSNRARSSSGSKRAVSLVAAGRGF